MRAAISLGLLLWIPGCEGNAPTKTDGPPADGGPPAGIAASYPGDQGIGSDPRVIFADDFESYSSADDLPNRYDDVFEMDHTRIETAAKNVYAGSQSLEFTLPKRDFEFSNAVNIVLEHKLDVLYLRYYSKFESTYNIIGLSHNGGEISAGYFVNGTDPTPGIPADGTNKYLIGYESWRGLFDDPNPGLLNIFLYRPGQRSNDGDHLFPDGLVLPDPSQREDWGPNFVPRDNIIVGSGRWYEYEVMLKANTPGERDGRITAWLDGQIIADFPDLRLRDVDTLKIDHFSVGLHAASNSGGPTSKWYDNLVAATEYIGPMVAP